MVKQFYLQCSEFPKLYRFEGTKSYHHFDFSSKNFLNHTNHYIYFSKTLKHHSFYTAKRLRQFIENELLEGKKFALKQSIADIDQFQKMIQMIECSPLEEQTSIEFTTSPIFFKLLADNTTFHSEKAKGEHLAEKVDGKQSGGGYGFCDEWLELFQFFTYFYVHQRIRRNDVINFLYAYRNKILHHSFPSSLVPFLIDGTKKVIEEKPQMFSSFNKYELMDILERILAKGLYFPNSFLGEQQEDGIKKIVAEYLMEKEVLEEVKEYSKKCL